MEVAREESVRNRVMLALAYDAALRREELCSLRTDDPHQPSRCLTKSGCGSPTSMGVLVEAVADAEAMRIEGALHSDGAIGQVLS
ncbi:hypothetical protein ABZX39_35625 [Streptomyces collinus]|uniref:hypothetical protein n=1 Tax=Streptomyces collinus TaxID=42684 RepID=UPI0033B0543E